MVYDNDDEGVQDRPVTIAGIRDFGTDKIFVELGVIGCSTPAIFQFGE